jgi:hypothetical protein
MAQPQPERTRTFSEPPPYFAEALHDAERLLKYASEIGISVEDNVRNAVLEARIASTTEWDEETIADLLSALSKLAAKLTPVTAQSLRVWSGKPSIRKYLIVSICLAILIVPFSAASFIEVAVSKSITTNIAAANDLTAKLREQVGSPQGGATNTSPNYETTVIAELQQFASDIREIDAQARQLHVLVFGLETDPFRDIRGNAKALHDKFQLPDGLKDFAAAANERTAVLQDVRFFGQSLVDDAAVIYGAITACILPILYALLGTCAYLLRNFELQIATRTYTPSAADAARFLIAIIGGAVVGLFNNFVLGQGVSIPPLALAFLVGYAVDVFFAFLEGLSHQLTKGAPPPSTPPAANGAKVA